MSTPLDLKLDADKVQEIPMVDLAFLVLKTANTPFYYRDLMSEVAKLRGLTAEQINNFIAQLYTEINIDGRFACVGQNLWGLKRWYPVDRSEDSMSSSTPRSRIIINDDDDYADDDDNYHNDEEEGPDFVDGDGENVEIFEDDESNVNDTDDLKEEIDEDDIELSEDDQEDEFYKDKDKEDRI